MGYCCFNGEAFPRFNFIQYGRHALSYLLVQVTVNVPLVQVKLLRPINGNTDSYLYSGLCERSLTVCPVQNKIRSRTFSFHHFALLRIPTFYLNFNQLQKVML